MAQQSVAGVDWAGGKWLAVILKDEYESRSILADDFASLWNEAPDVEEMLVDIPIGLPRDDDTLERREHLDSLARSKTGRSSSVFPVPSQDACRRAWEDEDYEAVADQNQSDLQKGLTWQSYYIAEACGEVDQFLDEKDEEVEDVIRESHPELCFRGLLGRNLEYSKTDAAGLGERLEALDDHLDEPGSTLHTLCRDLPENSEEVSVEDVTVDDIIDALGLAVTAWKGQDGGYTLPHDKESGSEDPIMQMAYWSEEPL